MNSTKSAFTLIEMLVVIAIIALLASLVSVGASKALFRAKETRKMVNLRTLFQANMMYVMDTGGYICPVEDDVNYDGGRNWRDLLAPYVSRESSSKGQANTERIFIDPFFDEYDPSKKHITGLGMNRNPGLPKVPQPNARKGEAWDRSFLLEDITYPALRSFIGDVRGSFFYNEDRYKELIDTTRHKNKGMYLMFDGSVTTLSQDQAERALLDPTGAP